MTPTPGPWRVETQPSDARLVAELVEGRPGLVHLRIVHDGAEDGDGRADACLIAAAPEMIEALKSALWWAEDDGPVSAEHREYRMVRLRAVIAKAEGRTT